MYIYVHIYIYVNINVNIYICITPNNSLIPKWVIIYGMWLYICMDCIANASQFFWIEWDILKHIPNIRLSNRGKINWWNRKGIWFYMHQQYWWFTLRSPQTWLYDIWYSWEIPIQNGLWKRCHHQTFVTECSDFELWACCNWPESIRI